MSTTAPFSDFAVLWDSLCADIDRGIPLETLRDQLRDTGQIFAETSTDPQSDVSLINLRRAYKRIQILMDRRATQFSDSETAQPKSIAYATDENPPPFSPDHNTPNGIYTVAMADGTHVTIKISPSFIADAAKEDQMAAFLYGPDNTRDFRGFAFVKGNRAIIWRRFRENHNRQVVALNALLQGDFTEHGARYAQQSGNCWHCGRTLTVPTSLHRGLGPICAERLGMA